MLALAAVLGSALVLVDLLLWVRAATLLAAIAFLVLWFTHPKPSEATEEDPGEDEPVVFEVRGRDRPTGASGGDGGQLEPPATDRAAGPRRPAARAAKG